MSSSAHHSDSGGSSATTTTTTATTTTPTTTTTTVISPSSSSSSSGAASSSSAPKASPSSKLQQQQQKGGSSAVAAPSSSGAATGKAAANLNLGVAASTSSSNATTATCTSISASPTSSRSSSPCSTPPPSSSPLLIVEQAPTGAASAYSGSTPPMSIQSSGSQPPSFGLGGGPSSSSSSPSSSSASLLYTPSHGHASSGGGGGGGTTHAASASAYSTSRAGRSLPKSSSGRSLDVNKLREKLQEVKKLDKLNDNKKLQEHLSFLMDQEEMLRQKIEKLTLPLSSSSPSSRSSSPPLSPKSQRRTASPSLTPTTSFTSAFSSSSSSGASSAATAAGGSGNTSNNNNSVMAYEKLLAEITSEISALKEICGTKSRRTSHKRTGSSIGLLKSARDKDHDLTTEESFTGAEYSFMSEVDTESFEDFSDDEEHEKEDTFSWNTLFQNLWEESPSKERESKWQALAQDFIHNATTYGKIIISETFVNSKHKTIKPLSCGGEDSSLEAAKLQSANLGFERYRHKGILYTLFMDSQKTYGSNQNAMKMGSHEILGCKSFVNCKVPALHFPFLVQIDFQGFRIVAHSGIFLFFFLSFLSFPSSFFLLSSVFLLFLETRYPSFLTTFLVFLLELPINERTLIYGSSDGLSVYNENVKFSKKMQQAASKMNLKKHLVGNKELCFNSEIEGHYGVDGRFYVKEFAGIMPPETPERGTQHTGLCNRLRPEFVRNNPSPLSSDAFSKFGMQRPENNQEIMEATKRLHNETIPQFATWLDGKDSKWLSSKFVGEEIAAVIHKHGINLRKLGLIRAKCRAKQVRSILLQEIVARTIKNKLRANLRTKTRESPPMLLTPVQNSVVDFLNLVFGKTKASKNFWTKELAYLIQHDFPKALSEQELNESTTTMIVDLRGTFGGPNNAAEKGQKKEGEEEDTDEEEEESDEDEDSTADEEDEEEFVERSERVERRASMSLASTSSSSSASTASAASGSAIYGREKKDNTSTNNNNNKAERGKKKEEKKKKKEEKKRKQEERKKERQKQKVEKGREKEKVKQQRSSTKLQHPLPNISSLPPHQQKEKENAALNANNNNNPNTTNEEEDEAMMSASVLDMVSLFRRVLSLSGVLLAVKPQQEFLESPNSGLWLYYQDIVGLQTRVKFLNSEGNMVQRMFL
ncbi:PICALM [Balamuthia mandrillaris]